MKSISTDNQQLQYEEVYISDLPTLAKMYLANFGKSEIDEIFGIPFLLIRKENQVIAFASLLVNNNKIDFKIFGISPFDEDVRRIFALRAAEYCRKSNSSNFRDVNQLKASIFQMISWLNN